MEQWQQTPEEAAAARSARIVIRSILATDVLIVAIAIVFYATGTLDGLVAVAMVAYAVVSGLVAVLILKPRLGRTPSRL